MEDAKEKNVELSSEDLDKVSGGYLHQRTKHDSDGDTVVVSELFCDVCRGSREYYDADTRGYKKRLLIPFQGGHICVDCLKKIEEELGRKIL